MVVRCKMAKERALWNMAIINLLLQLIHLQACLTTIISILQKITWHAHQFRLQTLLITSSIWEKITAWPKPLHLLKENLLDRLRQIWLILRSGIRVLGKMRIRQQNTHPSQDYHNSINLKPPSCSWITSISEFNSSKKREINEERNSCYNLI